jgi:hypothetical protein
MADYHPLIARAVAGLEKNTGENRRALYARAREALVGQLRGVQPALEESEITRERLALEEAIRKVEAEAARQGREALRPTLPRRAEPPRQEMPRQDMPRATPRPSSPTHPRPAAPMSPPRPAEGAPPQQQPRPAPGNRSSLQDQALRKFREGPPDSPPESRRPQFRDNGDQILPASGRMQPRDFGEQILPAAPPPASAPEPPEQYARKEHAESHEPAAPERHALEDYGQLEPQMEPENLWALPLYSTPAEPPVDLDAQSPPPERAAPRYEPEEREPVRRPPRSYAGLIRLGLALVLLLVIGGLVVWQRATIVNVATNVVAMFRSSPSAPPKEAAAPARPKITDRIGQPSPAPSTSGPPVAQRVVLYEEEPDDPQGKRFVGTVLWKTEMRPATPGRPPELAVRADVEVPERKMSVTFSFRRNTDASLPASHTIEIVFTLPADSPSGGVQKVPGVLMKQSESTRGVPLAGLAVPVTPGYFLIGLSSLESDMQRNLQLLKERAWFDVPIIYNNNRRAILAMEKGAPGEQAFAAAFAAWKQ